MVANHTRESDARIFGFPIVEGKFSMFLNRIWGSQVETRRWALEIKPKGFWCHVSLFNQEIEGATIKPNKHVTVVSLLC